jgi:hypothetical protein
MDPNKFDTIVKSLSGETSRRRLLKGLGASALGAVVVSRTSGAAVAQVTCPAGGQRCRQNADCNQFNTNPCCVAECERGNAGVGGGGNFCSFTTITCPEGREPVLQGGRCRCRPA